MRNIALSLLIGFFVSFGKADQDILVEYATDQEAHQVQEVSDTFEKRMRETRDVNSLKDLFLNDFMRLQLEHKSRPLVLIPSVPISIETDLITQITQEEWERFYAAQLNLRYYFVLLIASRAKPSDLKSPDFKGKIFPREVFTVLEANPFLSGQYSLQGNQKKYNIETVEEMRSLITTLEQATLLLRQRFLKDPPEQTSIYRENVRRAPNEERSTRLIRPDVYGTGESRLGFPKGTRFFHRLTADRLFELWLVKTDSGMKIVWAQVYPFN